MHLIYSPSCQFFGLFMENSLSTKQMVNVCCTNFICYPKKYFPKVHQTSVSLLYLKSIDAKINQGMWPTHPASNTFSIQHILTRKPLHYLYTILAQQTVLQYVSSTRLCICIKHLG
ncbi:hypothetical protein XENTR_v10000984 [Xenopus tropicalis]|nr:hypothetical protein XENTR_v10000984 [Xenopus tropicalis]